MSFELKASPGVVVKGAVISPCKSYRYQLTRVWDSGKEQLVVIMCNPSTADAYEDDPTIRVLMGMARRKAYGGIVVANCFAFRASDPAALKKAADPIGPFNDGWLGEAIATARDGRPVLCAWGDIGAGERANAVLDLVVEEGRSPVAIRLSKAGNPVHPLRQKLDGPFVAIPRPAR